MVSILIRTIFIYLYLILCMRLTGKRQIGELQLSELITALLLSELARRAYGKSVHSPAACNPPDNSAYQSRDHRNDACNKIRFHPPNS